MNRKSLIEPIFVLRVGNRVRVISSLYRIKGNRNFVSMARAPADPNSIVGTKIEFELASSVD